MEPHTCTCDCTSVPYSRINLDIHKFLYFNFICKTLVYFHCIGRSMRESGLLCVVTGSYKVSPFTLQEAIQFRSVTSEKPQAQEHSGQSNTSRHIGSIHRSDVTLQHE